MIWQRHQGWLLLSWRLQHAEAAASGAAAWLRSGAIPTYDDFASEERACDLPEGMLASIPELQWLTDPAAGQRPTPADGRDASLLERALAGEATSSQWAALARRIARGEHLPSEHAAALIGTLLDALPRGVGHTYRLLRIAALSLLALPEHREHFVSAIRRGVEDVDGPAFLEPIGLLDVISTKSSHSLILDLLAGSRNRNERAYAAWLATQVWIRGGFDEADRARVVMIVLTVWRADPVQARDDLGQLIDVLPAGVRGTLTRARDLESRSRREELDEQNAAVQGPVVVNEVVDAVVAQSHPGLDVLLPGLHDLLRTALFQRASEQRYQAAQLLGASPLRAPIGSALLDRLARPGTPDRIRQRAASVVKNVVVDEHRLRLMPFVRDADPSVAAAVTTALGHVPLSAMSDQEVRKVLPKDRLPMGRACLYALGMTGSDALAPLATSSSVPRWQSRTARWWLGAGPAMVES